MHVRISLFALILVLSSATLRVDAGERLVMTVSPAQAFAPATLRIQARLERDADNRELEIAVDSGDYYRSSLIDLSGERAPSVVIVEFRSVPGGEYEVRGALRDAAGHERACVRQQANIIGRDSDE